MLAVAFPPSPRSPRAPTGSTGCLGLGRASNSGSLARQTRSQPQHSIPTSRGQSGKPGVDGTKAGCSFDGGIGVLAIAVGAGLAEMLAADTPWAGTVGSLIAGVEPAGMRSAGS
eukprot:CAMPEP_0172635570 /NCGR_PEP_ID=MMETSP1068-20121228/200124_1 /TAXON_ID=35684 /ORGANISM="Pseudopedinella elastica, Strain CCMP716" /LENGTH=113 /DNA_ID=CAMNT_0013447829 /DNA_START=232 /DNA_END=573 /DNA_ORIENTATION=-